MLHQGSGDFTHLVERESPTCDREAKRIKISRSFSFVEGGSNDRISSGTFSFQSSPGEPSSPRPDERLITSKNQSSLGEIRPLRSAARSNSLYEEIAYGVAETRGERRRMEDRHELYVIKPQSGAAGTLAIPHAFFAVYDGHGGEGCVDYIMAHLHEKLKEQLTALPEAKEALRESILQTDREFSKKVLAENLDGLLGSCLCAALIIGNTLYVANVGDSMAILYKEDKTIEQLTSPHTPKNKDENERVLKSGGKILKNRLCHPKWNPQLVNVAVTRALGDVYFKDKEYVGDSVSGLIADPEVTTHTLTGEDQFILMGSDGLWDVVTPKEAVAFVLKKKNLPPDEICEQLAQLAIQRASADNVTVLLVNLTHDLTNKSA